MLKSMVTVKIKSRLLVDILDAAYDELLDQILCNSANMLIRSNGEIEIVQCGNTYAPPKDLMDVLRIIAGMLDYNYGYVDGQDIGLPHCVDAVQKMFAESESIIESIESVEILGLAEGDYELESDEVFDANDIVSTSIVYDKAVGAFKTRRSLLKT